MQYLVTGAIVFSATVSAILALVVMICVPPAILQAEVGRLAREG
jgi:hypothetical protein